MLTVGDLSPVLLYFTSDQSRLYICELKMFPVCFWAETEELDLKGLVWWRGLVDSGTRLIEDHRGLEARLSKTITGT